MEQRTSEWHAARCGLITASRVDLVVNDRTKAGVRGSKATSYLWDLVGERITEQPAENFQNKAMRDGVEREPIALALYEQWQDVSTDSAGFIVHKELNYSGASPDALIAFDGGVEIKCPTLNTFLQWRLEDAIPFPHVPQIMWCMECTEREWWDFVAFHPSMPEGQQLIIKRVHRDDALISAYKKEVTKFHWEVEEIVQTLRLKNAENVHIA